jgi:Icc-related predicted phosphoesterase
VVAIAGDLTDPGRPETAVRLLGSIPVTTLVVPGNMDDARAAAAFSAGKAKNIHLKKEVVAGVAFVGLGGWMVSPSVHEKWGISPDEAEKELARIMPRGAVLLTHVPPFGHLDAVPVPDAFSSGRGEVEHIGSPQVRRLVDRFKPVLVISGHVHESRGIEEECGILYVNPGPARDGFGAIIELKGRARAELLTFSP